MSQDSIAPSPTTGKTSGGVSTVNHAIAVLKALPSSGASIGVNEIARITGLHKSSVSRLLTTMEKHQFVQRDSSNRRVGLGVGLVALVSPMLGNLDLMRMSKPILTELANETGETAILAVWNGREAVMLEQVIGPQAVVHYAWPGKTVPGHTTAAGKVFLAMLPNAFPQHPQAEYKRYTRYTRTAISEIAADLQLCRDKGYTMNDEENELESCGVAAPVFDFRNNVVAALSLAVPKHRFNEATLPKLINCTIDQAKKLSAHLGAIV
jgi:DNA-binding IclR family transcriptional regulator